MGSASLEGAAVSRLLIAGLLAWMASSAQVEAAAPAVLVVVGAEGTAEFGEQFRGWAERWKAAAETAKAEYRAIGLDAGGEKADREVFVEALEALATANSQETVWLVLIGHGTFDGKTPKFNLRGEDFTPGELKTWLQDMERPVAIINCASASGPFLNALSGEKRTVVTATRAGAEYNFARFGEHLSTAITNLQADLDKDDQVSLLEAFLFASAGVRDFYAGEGRLATEHALIDDNGDGLGTPADWFAGLRATKRAKDGAELDGTRAAQLVLVRSQREERLSPELRLRRDELERELAKLRQSKTELPEEEYLAQIEPILLELGRLYATAESQGQ